MGQEEQMKEEEVQINYYNNTNNNLSKNTVPLLSAAEHTLSDLAFVGSHISPFWVLISLLLTG